MWFEYFWVIRNNLFDIFIELYVYSQNNKFEDVGNKYKKSKKQLLVFFFEHVVTKLVVREKIGNK